MLVINAADDLRTTQTVQLLWKEYWAGLDLPGEFQGFDEELRTLPGKYAAPKGVLAIATLDGFPAGTVALRPLEMDACELKRLYVRPQFRRRGVGRALMKWIIERARSLGYKTAHGDTLPVMTDAMQMYRDFGFRVMDHPYSRNPTPGAIYLELRL
jgi:GNAT superfamily N-acetyltransferase